jgi:hypothetical protein
MSRKSFLERRLSRERERKRAEEIKLAGEAEKLLHATARLLHKKSFLSSPENQHSAGA